MNFNGIRENGRYFLRVAYVEFKAASTQER